MFLNPRKPIHICQRKSCDGCSVADKIVCHFDAKRLFGFLLLNIPLFIWGGYIAFRFSAWLFLFWLAFIFLFFGFIEIRVLCSHCPHYAEPETKTLKCWANYGSPKLWKYRPWPMNIYEKSILIFGFLIIFISPAILLLIQREYLFVILYVMLAALMGAGVQFFYCNKCFNFSCPLNRVPKEIVEEFLEKNPVMKNYS